MINRDGQNQSVEGLKVLFPETSHQCCCLIRLTSKVLYKVYT